MNTNFFFDKVGIDADLKRHKEMKEDLENQLKESIELGNVMYIRVCEHLLSQLEVSKSNITNKMLANSKKRKKK